MGPGLPPSASPRRGLTDLILRTLLSHPSFLSYIVEGEGSSDTHTSVSCLEGRGMELDVNMPAANWHKRRVRSLAVPSTHLSWVLRGRSAPGGPSHPVAQHCAIVVRGENILQLIIRLDSTWHQVCPPHLARGRLYSLITEARASIVEAGRRRALPSPACVTNSPMATEKQPWN